VSKQALGKITHDIRNSYSDCIPVGKTKSTNIFCVNCRADVTYDACIIEKDTRWVFQVTRMQGKLEQTSSGVTLYGMRKSNILVFRKDSFPLAENRQAQTTHPLTLSSCFLWKTYCHIYEGNMTTRTHDFRKITRPAECYHGNDSQTISFCLASSWLFVYKAYIFISSMYVSLSLLSAMSKYFHCKRDQRRDNLNELLHSWLPSKVQDRPFSTHI